MSRGSIHARAIEELVEENYGNADFMETYGNIAKRMNSGYYDQEWIDTIVQRHREGGRYSLSDAVCVGRIMHGIWSGYIYQTKIETSGLPTADSDVIGNQSSLDNLPIPFSAKFWGGNKTDHDGILSWKEDIKLTQANGNFDPPRYRAVMHEQFSAPLEVGYTDASCTWFRLLKSRAVARWPYGHRCITLYVAVENDWNSKIQSPSEEEAFNDLFRDAISLS